MTNPQEKYENALAAFVQPGARWANKGALTYWGKAAGLTAEEIISDARAHGVTNRDADIRRGWNDATPKSANGGTAWNRVPRAKPNPPPSRPNYVRELMQAGCETAPGARLIAYPELGAYEPAEPVPTERGNFGWLYECSPCLDWLGKSPAAQTELFLQAAFNHWEIVYCFRANPPTPGVLGKSVRHAGDWVLAAHCGGTMDGECVVPNPFTGKEGNTRDGKKSFVADECLAAFPFLVVEFDDMPLAEQCAFWRGFICDCPLAPKLVSLTYSGGKSIHGLLNVEAAGVRGWESVRDHVVGLLAAAPQCTVDADGRTRYPFRADRQAMRPRQGTRLPGMTRTDTGRLQELLYLNPKARKGTMANP